MKEERRLRVYENRVLRRIFGRKRDEVRKELRKLHNEELNDLYSLPKIVRVIKSRRMRWVGGGSMWQAWGRGVEYTRFWWGYLMERDHLGDPDVDERIILKRILRK